MIPFLLGPALLGACPLLTAAELEQWRRDHAEAGSPGSRDTATDTAADTATDSGAGSDYTASYGIEMIALSAASFSMGSGAGDPDSEYTDHDVTLTRGFWVGRSEVTQAAWAAWGDAPNRWPSYNSGCEACPVEQVSWVDIALFANALSAAEALEGCYLPDGSDGAGDFAADPYACRGYRLPTEAEWEYAARAGEDTEFSGSNDADAVAWTDESSGGSREVCTTPQPHNAWGLCDLSGNVWEWVNDWYEPGYYEIAPSQDPPGPSRGDYRGYRGGGWRGPPEEARVAFRYFGAPSSYDGPLGFRLVRSR